MKTNMSCYRKTASLGRRVLPLAAATLLLPTLAVAKDAYTSWSPSVAAPDIANSVNGGCPIEAGDGLAIYTAREAGSEIYANERANIGDAFGPAVKLPAPINTPTAREFCPSPTGTEYFLFVSTRDGGCGSDGDGTSDIYIVRRGAADGWGDPVNVGCVADGTGPNTPGSEFSPSLIDTEFGMFLFFSSDADGDQDIYVSRYSDGSFGPGQPLDELNTEYDDRMPNVSQDGKEIVFSSNRPTWGRPEQAAAGGQDVYTAKRGSVHARFSRPENLSVTSGFSTQAASETRASMSFDRLRLYYGSGGEIYVSERERKNQN